MREIFLLLLVPFCDEGDLIEEGELLRVPLSGTCKKTINEARQAQEEDASDSSSQDEEDGPHMNTK